jgi:hypothetical protein
MVERDVPDRRSAFLAFLEQHWRELSLRDATTLCADLVELSDEPLPMIKETLTCS